MEAVTGAEAVAGLEARAAAPATGGSLLAAEGLRVAYAGVDVLKGVSLSWHPRTVNALIGPSGCGKTTLLRALNRLVELAPGSRVEGKIALGGADVMAMPAHEVRRRVGMVFQRPNPFPMSIFDNIAYALRNQASRFPRRRVLAGRVEEVLRKVALWDEVKEDLGRPALRLSGGQQQRLCIARVVAASPDVILMDEPCSSLDPRSTAAVEELIAQLRAEFTVLIVTHNLAQARRVADRAALLYLGELVEEADAETLLTRPAEARTRDFVAGLYG
jgi:phosphate transport system ATP-binding protein